MKEIGGYFGLEAFEGEEYYDDLIAVNNARNALLYILKAKKAKKLYVPYFLCDSVSEMCKREKYEIEYYSIDKSFMPVFDKKLEKDEYLYVVNYYGQLSSDKALALKERHKNIILDNVQAFFERPIDNIDTVYSCRKFFGVADGGYVFTNATLNENLCADASMDRMKHVLGRFETENASLYYSNFKDNDVSFKQEELKEMSKLTHNILRAIDYTHVQKKREENFLYLESMLGDLNELKLIIPKGPYAYPFYCKNGMQMKKHLAQKKIYVATLWPNVLEMEGTVEKDFAENILPLPIDQRYSLEDMKRVVEELVKELEERNV